jgi:pyrroline-5-carboxylate reductase
LSTCCLLGTNPRRRLETNMTKPTIAFIGGGQLTEFLLDNLLGTETVAKERVIVSDPDLKRRDHLEQKFAVETTADNVEAADRAGLVFICVRPQDIKRVIDDLGRVRFSEDHVLATLSGGIPIQRYAELRSRLPVVRALPNPPSQIGLGSVAVVFNEFVSSLQRMEILELFESMGKVEILAEEHMNAATALSGPAPVLLFFEALIDAGVRLGLERATSESIAHQTIVGVLEVWRRRQVSPEDLLREACTPGGLSEESIAVLEKLGFQAVIIEAIRDTAQKAERLAGISQG